MRINNLIIIVISFAILGFSCVKSSVTSVNNGYIQEGKTVDGKKEGEWVTFQDGKRVASITYKDGLMNGLVLSWHDNGQMADSAYYKNDSAFGTSKSWFDNGKLNHVVHYDSLSRKDGVEFVYYENGSVRQTIEYHQGKYHGKWVDFYENGLIEFVNFYKYGKREGKWIYFSNNGDTLKIEYYKDGILQM